jgi:hypothetical protein
MKALRYKVLCAKRQYRGKDKELELSRWMAKKGEKFLMGIGRVLDEALVMNGLEMERLVDLGCFVADLESGLGFQVWVSIRFPLVEKLELPNHFILLNLQHDKTVQRQDSSILLVSSCKSFLVYLANLLVSI